MKYLSHYSLQKFASFSLEQKIQALHKLISTLEQELGNEAERIRIIRHLQELRTFTPKELPERLSLFLSELHPRLSPHQLLNKLYFYFQGALRQDSQMKLKEPAIMGEISPETRLQAAQITLIADNLRSVFNVGSLFRSAECLGIKEIMLCGISPTPDHPHLPKTAMGTQQLVSWKKFPTTPEAISHCKTRGYRIYALETTPEAKSIYAGKFRFPLALVLGNEALGIDPEVLAACEEAVYLPQLGWKSSLNVGVATSIALYQIIFGVHNG